MPGFRNFALVAIAFGSVWLFANCGGGGGSPTADGGQNPATISVQRVFSGMPAFSQPVAMLQSPGDDSRWFVLEQAGKVRKFSNVSSASAAADFLDITGRVTSGGETGLLGMAFHPHFPADPRVYISYTQTDSTLGLVSRISEFSSPDAGATLDSGSEQIILTVQQPESNHNGGNIAFGPDGFLYIGFGDGGGGNDQHGTTGNGQLLTTLLGKILRIDIDGPAPYGIPATNPFSGHALCGANGSGPASCPEIFAFGFRNPWRWSFDRQNGELWVGDVGQSAMEEIDRVTRGGNYGWRCFEGTLATGMTCGTTAGFLAPVAAYGRSVGATVIGGYVYRGSAIPALAGRYVFGDFVTGRIFQIASSAQPTVTVSGGLSTGLGISAFAQDRNGELYVVSYSGQLYRISG